MPTAPAAAYPPALCASYAAIVHKLNVATSARERVKIVTRGKVRRHIDRGETRESKREKREEEDDQSWAGARNAAEIIAKWPRYSQVMAPVRDKLIDIIRATPALQGQTAACGDNPSQAPPSEATLKEVRRQLGPVLGLSPADQEASHPASPWRFGWVKALTEATDDDPHI